MFACGVSLALLLALPGASVALKTSSSRLSVVTPTAETAPPLREEEGDALIQEDAALEKHVKTRPPKQSAWFGGFSSGESTFEYGGRFRERDVNTQIDVMDGWYPHQANPYEDKAKDAVWFEETKSGGAKEPWQSFFPALKSSIAGNEVQTGKWYEGTGGVWQQEYQDPRGEQVGDLPASWFDDSVRQLDGFGRKKLPSLGSPRNYIDWEERSVNTSLTCKAPGCTANVSLLAPFDFNTEVTKNCKISVFFHPTDYDDWFIGEHVDWVEVNNQRVSSKCHPYVDGCNQTAARPLLPCVDDVALENLMPSNGALTIAAKIPEVVDECPYKGNMLSAVPMVTCLVAPKPNGSRPMPKKVPVSTIENMVCVTKMPLQCSTKGCAAEVNIPINSTCASLGQCTLSVNVSQTDFDNKDGTAELIEYISINGKQVVSKLKPGQNPCKSKWHGKPITDAQETFSALTNHVLNVSGGQVLIEGKISKYVDECPSNGYLFDAMAEVTCKKK